MRFMVFVLLAAVLALSGIVAYQFNQIAQSRAQGRSQSVYTWRAVICSIEKVAIKNPETPRDQKVRSVEFFDGLLVNNVRTAPCGLRVPRS
jgi:hypothetical protein